MVVSKWKAAFLENLSATFERSDSTDVQDQDTEERYAAICQLKVENEFLIKYRKRLGIEF